MQIAIVNQLTPENKLWSFLKTSFSMLWFLCSGTLVFLCNARSMISWSGDVLLDMFKTSSLYISELLEDSKASSLCRRIRSRSLTNIESWEDRGHGLDTELLLVCNFLAIRERCEVAPINEWLLFDSSGSIAYSLFTIILGAGNGGAVTDGVDWTLGDITITGLSFGITVAEAPNPRSSDSWLILFEWLKQFCAFMLVGAFDSFRWRWLSLLLWWRQRPRIFKISPPRNTSVRISLETVASPTYMYCTRIWIAFRLNSGGRTMYVELFTEDGIASKIDAKNWNENPCFIYQIDFDSGQALLSQQRKCMTIKSCRLLLLNRLSRSIQWIAALDAAIVVSYNQFIIPVNGRTAFYNNNKIFDLHGCRSSIWFDGLV